jgi:hypothetical protein
MKIIVAGTRFFNDYNFLKKKLDYYFKNLSLEDIEIVSGKAKGADTLGELYANENNIKIIEFPADWEKFGKKAGLMLSRHCPALPQYSPEAVNSR